MSPLVALFLNSAVVPAVITAIVFFLLGGLSDPLRARLQSLIFALGFAYGSYVLVGRLNFPPSDVSEAFSVAALALAAFVILSPRPVGARYLIRAVFVLAIGAMALWPIHESLHGTVHLRNMLAFFFLGLGTWSILEQATQRVQSLTLLALPLVAATALSFLLLFKGSASMSQQVSVLCTMLGAVASIALVFPRRVSMASFLPFVSVFVVLFMTAGHFYLDINPWHMIYISLPFGILWVRGWIPFIPRRPLPEALLLSIISAIPLGYFLWTIYQVTGPLE